MTSSWPTLAGRAVVLEPLAVDHVDALVSAANADRTTFGLTLVPDSHETMLAYVTGLLADRDAGRAVPFVQRDTRDGAVVGCTRFMDIRYWYGRRDDAGSAVPDEVEIGGTWLTPSAQRTAVNTEAKLMLLRHAFEVWQVQRVAVCTDERNLQSRRAIERIGAAFEGILRSHRPSTASGEGGTLRNTAVYSIVRSEWPAVETALVARLGYRG